MAKKRNKKGRAIVGMLMGTRREIVDQKGQEKMKIEGIITGGFKYKGDRVKMIGVYSNRDIEAKLESLEEWMEDKEEEGRTLIEATLTQGQEIRKVESIRRKRERS